MRFAPWIWLLGGIGGMGESHAVKPQIALYRNALVSGLARFPVRFFGRHSRE
jgi:hypothetical protein